MHNLQLALKTECNTLQKQYLEKYTQHLSMYVAVIHDALQVFGGFSRLVTTSVLEVLDHVHLSVDSCRIDGQLPSIVLGLHVSASIQ